ncbi:GntR family transcriptional regulator [Albimonas sp. CAU 1670]|uniref:GntR family transcriptional regulator n=1 Tax=Albimonas sp. CAU 1670 TaxID=3032599 RepID=UPI0023DBBC67|nr:GntR family transcriptional regulator [Albimonas sp. CAU 1670]MDF2232373.1 GntR family transcriptional regulator [Albimonas sp. CAU 1670]
MRQATDPLKTQRVYLLLRDQIVSGELAAGARLPGEPTLAEEHAVSRVTIRRALGRLAEEGLITKRAGSGTYVREAEPRVRAAIADVSNVFSNLIEMGRTTEARLLSFDYMAPPAPVREALGLEADERAQRSVRVRLVDGAPFSHLTAHVPERIGRDWSREEMNREPLLALIERAGFAAARATQEISAVLAGPEVAEALDVSVGSPLVALTRVVFGPGEEALEHLQALYRPDRYHLSMNLVRTGGAADGRWRPAATPAPAPDAEAEIEAEAAKP